MFQFASAPHMCTWDPLARRAHSGPAQAGEQGQGKSACVCPWADHLPSAGPRLPSVSPCPPLANKDIESMSCCAVRRQWPPSAAVSIGVKGTRTPESPSYSRLTLLDASAQHAALTATHNLTYFAHCRFHRPQERILPPAGRDITLNPSPGIISWRSLEKKQKANWPWL